MRILDRYIISIFLRNFLTAIIALICLFLFQALLADLYDRTYPMNQLIYYHFLRIPQVAVEVMAPSILLSTILTLGSLNRSHEIIACYSIGVGLKRIVALLIGVVFIISCLVLIMEDRILPPTYKKRTTFYWHVMEKRPDFFLDIKKDKIWYRSRNLIYNLQRFDSASNEILGMAVYTFDENFNLVQVIDAEKAAFTPQGWRLMKGTVTVFSQDDPFPLTKQFDEKALTISETPKDFQEIEKEVDGLRLKELLRYIHRMQEAGADTKSYEVKFHSRISLSFIPMVMCFLGVPFSVRSRRSGGVAKDLGLCLAITFFYWLFYSVGLSLGTNGALPPIVAAWLPSIVFAGVAFALIARQD